jgi:8-amino-7-oxononanoate synthase
LIVTDSLFSMDGDIAPLARLADLASEYDAMLLVDEAHATGVFGGGQDSFPKGDKPHFGDPHRHAQQSARHRRLCLRPQSLIDWLANRMTVYLLDRPARRHERAAIAALDVVATEPHRRRGLLRQAHLRLRLSEQGWDTGNSQSQIIPIYLGDPDRTMHLAAALRKAGYFLPGIRPPTVPAGESLLRISLCYHHTPAMIDALRRHGQNQRRIVLTGGYNSSVGKLSETGLAGTANS